MIYKFTIGSEEAENFKLEIAIDSEDTFLRLRNTIMDAAGYDKEQMNSFYICDDEWNREKEVTYMDMGLDNNDEDIWIMEDTRLSELIEDEGQKMLFVFDYLTERNFYIKLKETVPGKSLHDPICQRKEGKAPALVIDPDVFEPVIPKIPDASNIEELPEEFYGDETFNEDEIDDLSEIDHNDL